MHLTLKNDSAIIEISICITWIQNKGTWTPYLTKQRSTNQLVSFICAKVIVSLLHPHPLKNTAKSYHLFTNIVSKAQKTTVCKNIKNNRKVKTKIQATPFSLI